MSTEPDDSEPQVPFSPARTGEQGAASIAWPHASRSLILGGSGSSSRFRALPGLLTCSWAILGLRERWP